MRFLTLPAVLFLAACGPFADNTDKTPGVSMGGGNAAGTFDVVMANDRPETGGYPVEGISCKNKIWDPSPTEESAKAVMRREAAKLGFTSVYLLIVEPVQAAIALNCWSAISAKGIAFNP